MAIPARSEASGVIVPPIPLRRAKKRPAPKPVLSERFWQVVLVTVLLVGCLTVRGLSLGEAQQLSKRQRQQTVLRQQVRALRAALERRLSALAGSTHPPSVSPIPLTVLSPTQKTLLLGRR